MADANTGARPIHIVALGCALSAALVVFYVVCTIAGLMFPEAPLAHGWLALFSAAPLGSARSLVEGIVWSVAFAWAAAAIVGFVYNRIVARG